jgi:hypothetical protein
MKYGPLAGTDTCDQSSRGEEVLISLIIAVTHTFRQNSATTLWGIAAQ